MNIILVPILISMRGIFLIFISIISLQGFAQCPQLWSRVQVKEAPDFKAYQKSYIIQIEVLHGEKSGCMPIGNSINYSIYNSCGSSWQQTAKLNAGGDSINELCIPKSKMGFDDIRAFTFTDTFYLDSGNTCQNLLVYYESPSVGYLNFDSVPVTSWVLLNTHVRNNPVQLDTNFRLLEACNQEKRYYKPAYADVDEDSLKVNLAAAINYKPSTGLFPTKNEVPLKFPYTTQIPFGAIDFAIKKQAMSFLPFDTGFYGVPVTITEYKDSKNPFIGMVKAATSYFQISVLISEDCFPGLYFFGVFPEDTLKTFCGSGVITVPLSTRILTSSISPDGTDYKFSNDQGYPVIINKVIIPKDTLYVDELKMDVSFFFDGDYKLSIVRGTDRNKVFHECGYELLESDYFHLSLNNCPNEVHFGMGESSIGIEVFPNPFTDKIVLNLPQGKLARVQLINSVGVEMPVTANANKNSLELHADVPSGFYILNIQMKDGTQSSLRLVRR